MGKLNIVSSETHILEILFDVKEKTEAHELPEVHKRCRMQLDAYFKGNLKKFDVPLNPKGTSFQQRVWNALVKIPFGTTTTYLKLSESLGDTKAIRAAAAANGKNKIPIIIPCHRVIGSDGSLVGFAGGLDKKEWLLHHEGAISQLRIFSTA